MSSQQPFKLSLKASKGDFLFTLFLGLIPFVPYVWGRSTGALPHPEEWLKYGSIHGPWHNTIYDETVLLSLFLLSALSFWTCLAALGESFKQRKLRPLIQGLGISILQLMFAIVQLQTIFWVIE